MMERSQSLTYLKEVIGSSKKYKDKPDTKVLKAVSKEKVWNLVSIPDKKNGEGEFTSNFINSTLDQNSLPFTYWGFISIPVTSEFYIETESLERYLQGLSMEKFQPSEIKERIRKDLEHLLACSVKVSITLIRNSSPPIQGLATPDLIKYISKPDIVYKNPDFRSLKKDNGTKRIFHFKDFQFQCPLNGKSISGSVEIKMVGRDIPSWNSCYTYLLQYRKTECISELVCEKIYQDFSMLDPRRLAVIVYTDRIGGISSSHIKSKGYEKNIGRRIWSQ